MYKIKKTFCAETGHILDKSYMPECQRFHGHSAKIIVSIMSPRLNQDGMVIDFKLLKELFQPIYEKLDHHFLISEKSLNEYFPLYTPDIDAGLSIVPFNPTAENIAKWIFDSLKETMRTRFSEDFIILESIQYWETDGCCAEYNPKPW